MATTFTLSQTKSFPVGTTVGAYKASGWPPSQLPPVGAAVPSADTTAVVASDGTTAFTGLTTGIDYYAGASVSGTWRYIHFTTFDAKSYPPGGPAGGGLAGTYPNPSLVLPIAGTVVAGSLVLSNKLLAGDANPAFDIKGDGTLEWGPGGATAVDTQLYRGAAGQLKTDSHFLANTTYIQVGPSTALVDIGTTAALGVGAAANSSCLVAVNAELALAGGNSGTASVRMGATTLGFYGTAPIAKQLLATGAAHTVDDVITALQALGLVKQS